MIFPESFSPPAPPDPTAAHRPPSTILLDLDAYIADRSNGTTATATSRRGHTIQVSFWAADPPAMSYLCVHCLCAGKSEEKEGSSCFDHEPRVVGAEGRFVLLSVRFADASRDDYFMYKSDPDSPSLEPVPINHRVLLEEFPIVPRGDDGHYLLVALSLASSNPIQRELLIYSSMDQTWSSKPLPDAPDAGYTAVDKVITLGDQGLLGWVDLRKGVVVCDVHREPLDVRFIPLPSPLPENRERLKEFHPGDPAARVRDVTFSNGVIKFIEVEHRWIVTTIAPDKPTDPSEKDVLHDSDLIMERKRKDEKPRQIRRRDGWRAVTWSRTVSSNCWHKGRVIDADEISVDDAIYSSLIAGLRDDHDKSLKFRNMPSYMPTLSTDVEDLVYLKAVVRANDTEGWVVGLDLAKKTLTAIASYSFARHDPCIYGYRLCSLSNHLNMTSGNCFELLLP